MPGATGEPGEPGAPGLPSTGGLPKIGQTPAGSQGDEPGAFPPIGKPIGGSSETTGLPIAGVKSRCKERPFRQYMNKTAYNEWTFSIFDLDPKAPAMNTPAVNQQSFPPTTTRNP